MHVSFETVRTISRMLLLIYLGSLVLGKNCFKVNGMEVLYDNCVVFPTTNSYRI